MARADKETKEGKRAYDEGLIIKRTEGIGQRRDFPRHLLERVESPLKRNKKTINTNREGERYDMHLQSGSQKQKKRMETKERGWTDETLSGKLSQGKRNGFSTRNKGGER